MSAAFGFCPWQLLLGSSIQDEWHDGARAVIPRVQSNLAYFIGHFDEFYGNAGSVQASAPLQGLLGKAGDVL